MPGAVGERALIESLQVLEQEVGQDSAAHSRHAPRRDRVRELVCEPIDLGFVASAGRALRDSRPRAIVNAVSRGARRAPA